MSFTFVGGLLLVVFLMTYRRKPKPVAVAPRQHAPHPAKVAFAFRYHIDTEDTRAWMEWINTEVLEDTFTAIIDKERTIALDSKLGPEATIVWRYDREKLARHFSSPHLSPDHDPPIENYGDLPLGISQCFNDCAHRFQPRGSIDPFTGQKYKEANDIPKNFRESDIRMSVEHRPITILKLEYNDRRPKPDAELPPMPTSEEAVILGEAYPPPDPKPKVLDEWTTPYWEYPQPKQAAPAIIRYADRQTIHIMGQPDMGKSTLMRSMFRQDVAAGKGVTLIDPHGDLANQALCSIPRSRWDDVIYFDPIRCPIGIDFLKYDNEFERDAVADDLFAMFKHLTKGEGERMDAILKNAFPLLLRTSGATFLDLYRLVTDATYRKRVAGEVTDELLKDFWLVQYPKFPPVAAEPLISRMQRFQANQALRTTFGTTSELDFYDVIRQRKILICNMSAEYLRGETKDIIGALLVMKLHLAALKQAGVPENKRTLHYLYVDEFHTFKSSSFHEMITGDRKFGLRPTLANQYLDQLSPENYEAIRGAGFRVYFRLQDDDAPRLGRAVGGFAAADLLNLDKGEAILRPGKPSDTVKVELPPPEEDDDDATEYVIQRTQALYAKRRQITDEDEDDLWDQWQEHLRNGGEESTPPIPSDEPGPSSPPPD